MSDIIERIRQIASGELRQYESDRQRINAILKLIADEKETAS